MKKKMLMITLIVIALVLTGICYYLNNNGKPNEESNMSQEADFEVRFIRNDGNKLNKIVEKRKTEQYDYDIYTYKGDVEIIIGENTYTFLEALQSNKITIEEIIGKAIQDVNNGTATKDMYQDGGSMIYYYDTYTIIKGHSLDGNRNFYIGVPEMIFNDVK